MNGIRLRIDNLIRYFLNRLFENQLTIEIISGSEIRSKILEILLGHYFEKRNSQYPSLYLLSPWISDVEIEYCGSKIHSGIQSINLAYSLFLIKLFFGTEISIVTRPLDSSNYTKNLHYVRLLLEFLDEIGCNIFINPYLHAKLIMSNDLALLGSFNLSKSALYDNDELAVSVNDLDNLDKLEKYAKDIIQISEPYGFSNVYHIHPDYRERQYKFTRGWLLDRLVKELIWREDKYTFIHIYNRFLFKGKSFSEDLKLASSNLDEFYMSSIENLLRSYGELIVKRDVSPELALNYKEELKQTIEEESKTDPFFVILKVIHFEKIWFGWEQTPFSSLKLAMDFIKENLARQSIPNVKLRIKMREHEKET